MARFTLARFSDGDVVSAGWFEPEGGQKVCLGETDTPSGRGLEVSLADNEQAVLECKGVLYTWPRKKSHAEAALLAVRYYKRNTK